LALQRLMIWNILATRMPSSTSKACPSDPNRNGNNYTPK
jgi:hypothetical protein